MVTLSRCWQVVSRKRSQAPVPPLSRPAVGLFRSRHEYCSHQDSLNKARGFHSQLFAVEYMPRAKRGKETRHLFLQRVTQYGRYQLHIHTVQYPVLIFHDQLFGNDHVSPHLLISSTSTTPANTKHDLDPSRKLCTASCATSLWHGTQDHVVSIKPGLLCLRQSQSHNTAFDGGHHHQKLQHGRT